MDNRSLVTLVKRVELLAALHEEPHTTSELEGTLNASRATVHRAINSLREADIVRKDEQAFALTEYGVAIASVVIQFRDAAETVCNLEPFLAATSIDIAEIPLYAFSDATFLRPDPKETHRIETAIQDRIRTTESLQLFSSVVSPFYIGEIHDRVLEGADVEAIFDPQAVEVLFNKYSDLSRSAARDGAITIKMHEQCPFELFLFDETVGLVAHDARGFPQLFVEAANADVRRWAERQFARYDAESETVTLF